MINNISKNLLKNKNQKTLVIKRRFSSLFNKNTITKRNLLTKNIEYNKIMKKNMLSVGKILSGSEKEAASKIIYLVKFSLKKKPLNDNDMLNLMVQSVIISPQITQHFFAVTFPRYKMPFNVANKLPRVSFESSKKTEVDLDQILSACGVACGDKNPLFEGGTLISLGNRNLAVNAKAKTSQAYQNTNQKEPDYVYKYLRQETGEIFWIRYYDWKTGEIAPNSGHLYGTSDPKVFDTLSEILLKKQQKYYFKHQVLGKVLDELIKNKNLSWGEKNFQFQIFLKDNMHNLEQNINPSLIFKNVQFATAENSWKSSTYRLIEGSLKTDCFNSKDNSQKTIANSFMLGEKSPNVLDNYRNTKGHSTKIAEYCENLWQDYFHSLNI